MLVNDILHRLIVEQKQPKLNIRSDAVDIRTIIQYEPMIFSFACTSGVLPLDLTQEILDVVVPENKSLSEGKEHLT